MSLPATPDLLHEALQAERRGRFGEARDLLRQAAAGDGSAALDARLRLGQLLLHSGAAFREEALQILTAAHDQAQQAGAPRQTANAAHLLALLERVRGRPAEAAAWLDGSPAHTLDAAPGAEVGQLFHYRGLLATDRGDLANAERLFFRAHQVYGEIGHQQGTAEVCNSLANLLLRRGHGRAALAFARRGLAARKELGDRYGEALDWGAVGRAHLLQARYDEARAAFQANLDLSTELGIRDSVGIMLNSLGEVALLQHDLAGAREYHQRSQAEDPRPVNAAHAGLGLARVHLAAGNVDEAAAALDEVEMGMRAAPCPPAMSDALRGLRGAVAGRRGDAVEGERLLEQAAAALHAQEHPLDTVFLLYELRDLHQRRGRTPAAVRVMARALDVLSECGSERGVLDAEAWLRTADAPALTRLALEQHLPEYVVDSILQGNLAHRPTRRQEVTVLFSDIRDYTKLSEGLPPEEVVELLNEWFAEAARAVRRHGGVIDKFIGDAVMALFGVPEERPDAAADAVRAALALRDALAARNLRHKALGGHEVRIGVGLHTGAAVVGFIGSHLRRSYTAIGDVVNTASRLESETKKHHCDILISAEVQAAQERSGVAESQFLGKVKVKGKQEEVGIYKVLGLREGVSGNPAQ